jgi:hypothetical protein
MLPDVFDIKSLDLVVKYNGLLVKVRGRVPGVGGLVNIKSVKEGLNSSNRIFVSNIISVLF